MRWELRCSRDIAVLLGAIEPIDVAHYKQMFSSLGYILIRERTSGLPLFWPVQAPLVLR